jgi:hypothetical protein
MAHRVLHADESGGRRSTQMGMLDSDLGRQLDAQTLGVRLWRLESGQALTRHRHRAHVERSVLRERRGRIRIDDRPLTRASSAVRVEPESIRQLFNDTDADRPWLIVGAPPEAANTLEMTPENLAWYCPDGPRARAPELA